MAWDAKFINEVLDLLFVSDSGEYLEYDIVGYKVRTPQPAACHLEWGIFTYLRTYLLANLNCSQANSPTGGVYEYRLHVGF